MKWYIVRLIRGGAFRIRAESAEQARQRVTYDYMERVRAVGLDEDQTVSETEDY